MNTLGFPVLQQLPPAPGPQGQVGVLEDSIIGKELGKTEAGIEDLAPPESAVGSHEVDLSEALVRRLKVPVDWISGLEIIAARFVGPKQAQPSIPLPAGRGLRIQELIGDISGDTTYVSLGILLIHREHGFKKIRLEADVVIDEGNEGACCLIDADVALDRRAPATADIFYPVRQARDFATDHLAGVLFAERGCVNQNQFIR